jgi:uncharacterized membrane protein YdbT with pleckstrin-like domain
MAGYVENTLIPGERILHEAKISWWTQLPLVLVGILLVAGGVAQPIIMLFAIPVFLAAYIRRQSTELAVTNKRVVAKFGFIGRRTFEMQLSKIETIQVNQSLFGRIFDFGSLIVSGAGTPQEPIPGIAAPMAFRKAVMEAHEIAGPAK